MLLQLREERHAAEQAKQEEFAFEVGAATHTQKCQLVSFLQTVALAVLLMLLLLLYIFFSALHI